MSRFQYQKQSNNKIKIALVLCLFVAIIGIFYFCINSFSGAADSREKESLENALSRSITYCYAIEGSYPDSLKYLEKNYGLSYDKKKFFVDYRILGSNILPDVTIIELSKGKEEK